MAMLPFPPYAPDVTDFQAGTTATATNVLPRADGWGPAPSVSVFSTALPGVCRGVFYAGKADGTGKIFAATATKLYTMSNTDNTWSDVSKASGTYTTIPTGDQWQFRKFNNFVFATQINAPLQRFDLTSSTEFADCPGSPPQARYISVVGRFVVLSGLGSTTPYRIRWCGLNDTTNWTSGVNSSDFQDLPDGGIARGVAGGEFGIITQDAAIRRMTYQPGSPLVFQIDRISEEKGIFAPLSLITAGDRVFYYGIDGFKMVLPGAYPQAIGRERVDRTFRADLDAGNLQMVLAATDPKASRAYWSYKTSGSPSLFDKIVGYDWVLDRWFIIIQTGEYLASIATPGATLESLDSQFPSIDAMTISLDDYSTNTFAQLAIVDSAHKLGFFSGANLEATLVSAEQGGEGKRMYVRGFRPITDAATVFGSVSGRESLQASASYDLETAINVRGMIPKFLSTRYARGKIRIPASTAWTSAQGLEPDVAPAGKQ